MILKVKSARCLNGSVNLPASKSYSIRAFLTAACGGTSQIIRPSDCDDAKVAIAAAKYLGAKIALRVSLWGKTTWTVQVPKNTKAKTLSRPSVNVRESGTVLRFLLPLLSLYQQKIRIIGEGTLKGRPNSHLTRVLRSRGVMIKGTGSAESVPIDLSGGRFKGGRMEINGTLSSQFISALLMAGPGLDDDTRLIIKGKRPVSSDYITMTCQVLKKSGVKINKVHNRLYTMDGRQKFKGLKNFHVPSDYGLAAFLLAAGALTESRLVLKGHLKDDLIQADGKILDFLRRMGIKYKKSASALKICGPSRIKGGSFSLKDCPDLVPIMAVLALFARGKTRLYHIGHARAKESDRISDLRSELLKIGANVKEKRDELIIYPGQKYKNNVLLNPHHDHRLAMAFCVLGLKIGVRVKNIECVSKSYPAFVKDIRRIGAATIRV